MVALILGNPPYSALQDLSSLLALDPGWIYSFTLGTQKPKPKSILIRIGARISHVGGYPATTGTIIESKNLVLLSLSRYVQNQGPRHIPRHSRILSMRNTPNEDHSFGRYPRS